MTAPSVSALVESACSMAGVRVQAMRSADRYRSIAYPRFAVMWAAHRLTSMSSVQIGRALGGRDHSTVLNGIRRADELRRCDRDFLALTDALVARHG